MTLYDLIPPNDTKRLRPVGEWNSWQRLPVVHEIPKEEFDIPDDVRVNLKPVGGADDYEEFYAAKKYGQAELLQTFGVVGLGIGVNGFRVILRKVA